LKTIAASAPPGSDTKPRLSGVFVVERTGIELVTSSVVVARVVSPDTRISGIDSTVAGPVQGLRYWASNEPEAPGERAQTPSEL
jgi:hypothetical protein